MALLKVELFDGWKITIMKLDKRRIWSITG